MALTAMCEELRFHLRPPRVGSDSTAAKGAASRHGLGKLKHLELRFLWIQDAVRAGRVALAKEETATDLADPLTKHCAEEKMKALLTAAGYEFRADRNPGAPELAEGARQARLGAVLLGLGS